MIILEKSSSTQVLPDNFVKLLDGHLPQNMKLRQAGNGLRKMWDVEVVFDTDGSMYLDRGWKQFVRAYDLRHGYFLVFRYDGNATFAVKVFDTTMCRRRYQDDDDASMLHLFFLSIRLCLTPIFQKTFLHLARQWEQEQRVIGLFCWFSEMEFFTIILEKSSSRHVLPDNFVKMLDGHRPQNMNLRQDDNGLRKLWDVEVAFDTDVRHDYVSEALRGRRRCQSSEYCDTCYVYGSSDSGYSKSSSDSGYSKSSSDDGLAMVIPQLGDRAMPILVEEYIPQPGLGLHRSKRIRMMKEKVKKQE
ncbi:B3 domain-containing protein [Hordeum vulgare]|nr:B3 domain-containing protein [Hordeum vulgare]